MSYNCGGCGGGYCASSGIEQIVQYARPAFDGYSHQDDSIKYQGGHITESATAMPRYLDNLDSMIGRQSYTINLDRKPEVMSVGGASQNYKNRDYDNTVSENYNNTKPTPQQPEISVTPFVNQEVPTKFIGEVEEIRRHIEEAFEKVTGNKLPNNITIEVCDVERLKEIHEQFGGTWSPGIQGFAINKVHLGQPSHIFVKKGSLANVMVVIGHELGHIQSHTLISKHDEEAKAYAFEMAWIKAIYEHNIAELRAAINIDGKPAENGLHNIAFEFVHNLVNQGKQALEVFKELIEGQIKVNYDISVSLM